MDISFGDIFLFGKPNNNTPKLQNLSQVMYNIQKGINERKKVVVKKGIYLVSPERSKQRIYISPVGWEGDKFKCVCDWENKSFLDWLTLDMTIPMQRREHSPENYRWLLRNLSIYNQQHKYYEVSIKTIKELLS